MATKKEHALKCIEDVLAKGNQLLEKLNSKGYSEKQEVKAFAKLLKKLHNECVTNKNKKSVTIIFLNEKTKKIEDKIFHTSLLPIKFSKKDCFENKSGVYYATVIKNDEEITKTYHANSFLEIQYNILNSENINNIYSITCNDIYLNNIKDFFMLSEQELKIKSIANDGISDLRNFLLENKKNQSDWFEKAINKRKDIVKNHCEKYYYNETCCLKKEYKTRDINSEKNKEFKLAEKYIYEDYWTEENISKKMKSIMEKPVYIIYSTLEKQYCDEFKKINDCIITSGGEIEDIYTVG